MKHLLPEIVLICELRCKCEVFLTLKDCSTLMLLIFHLPPGHNSISPWPSTSQRPTVGGRSITLHVGNKITSPSLLSPFLLHTLITTHLIHTLYKTASRQPGRLQLPLELSHTSGSYCSLLHVSACHSQHVLKQKMGQTDPQTPSTELSGDFL